MVWVGEATANFTMDHLLYNQGKLKFRPNFRVREQHIHLRFDMENVSDTFIYDIAMIKLNQTIKAGTGKSICLPESRTALDPNLNEYGMIAGWGGSSNEILRLGYLKLNYERYKVSQFEFIYTKKLDDIRICEVSFRLFLYQHE